MTEHSSDLDALLHRGYRYALSLTHDPAGAEDLLQEACLSILKSRGEWYAGSLRTAIRHRFIDRLRRRGLTMESLDLVASAAATSAASMEIDPELEEALRHLRPAEREMLYLSAVEGMTAAQIAAALNRPRGTVLSLLLRAKRKVRQMLLTFGPSYRTRDEECHGS